MAGKRGHGEGTIYLRRDGRWHAQLSLAEGKRKNLYAKTRAEVVRKLREAQRTLDAGLPVVSDQQTVGQYLAQWLEMIRPTVKQRSWDRYALAIQKSILPTLASVKLAKLSAQQIQSLYAARLSDGQATATVNQLHTILHHALADALRLDLVARNVSELVTPPRAQYREMQILTQAQAQALLAAAQGDRLESLYVLALHTGMRSGELLALKWDDVDLTAGTLQVRYTLHHRKGGDWTLTPPKTHKSRRRIDLSRTCVEALQRHKAHQNTERLALGGEWADLGFVFTRPDGEPLRGTHVLQRSFHPLLRRAGLPMIRFHDLRHTAATLMLLANINPKVVSERLGHSNVAITLGLYSHVLPSMQQDAAATVERMLASERR